MFGGGFAMFGGVADVQLGGVVVQFGGALVRCRPRTETPPLRRGVPSRREIWLLLLARQP